jgi:MoaA/NifB/PqqE/SkfB family radical SAM enzyme
MAQIVDDVIDMGVKAVTFSGGGEPLLYKQLPETIKNLAAGGIRIGTLSNGSNLKGKVADAFAEYGTWIRISLDGWDDKSYAKARDIKEGAFTQLIENLRSFSSRTSKCTLGTSFIIDKNNYSHIFEVCAQLKDAGVQHVKLYGVIINNDGSKNNAYHHGIAEETMALIEKAKTLESDKFSIVNHYHLLEDRFEKTYTTCPFLTYLTIIGADSNVYTCQDKAYNKDGLLGSIKDRSFKNFWFSEENKQRMNAVNPSEMCKHHCVSNEKNLTLIEHLSLDEDHVTFV